MHVRSKVPISKSRDLIASSDNLDCPTGGSGLKPQTRPTLRVVKCAAFSVNPQMDKRSKLLEKDDKP